LVDEGFHITRERSGYFINGEILQKRVRQTREATSDDATGLDWAARFKLKPSRQRNIVKPIDWQNYPYPFVYGQLDPALFPINDWRECCRQTLSVKAIQQAARDRIDIDDPLLVEQIQSRILPRRGVWASRDQILVTLGAQQALYIIAQLLTDRSTVVGIENPGYVDARNIFASLCTNIVPIDVDEQGVVVDDRLKMCDYLYVTPSHQAPTTVTLPIDRREKLLAQADRDNFLIVEDDYESESNYESEPIPALKSLDRNERVIYVGSLSKTLAPGFRLGYLVGSPEFIREARALRRLMVRHPPANNQRTIALFLALGHHDSLISRLNRAYKERWKVMGKALDRYLPQSSRIPVFGGTCYWLKGPPELDANQLRAAAMEEGILIEPGDVFFMQEVPPNNFFRLGFSYISADRIEPGVSRLAAMIEKQVSTSDHCLVSNR
jgi:GntR family transcriptional regulator/MocR family aminotransferase